MLEKRTQILFFLFVFISSFVFATAQPLIDNLEEKSLKRVSSLMLIEDYREARQECEKVLELFPKNQMIQRTYIQTLASSGEEKLSLMALQNFWQKFPKEKQDRILLEDIGWSVLTRGIDSEQYTVRLASLIGAYLTRDARALFFILNAMNDSNAFLRSMAVRFAADFQDAPLQKKLVSLLDQERLWFVRLEVIRSLGKMKYAGAKEKFKEILLNDKTTFEEKAVTLEALVNISEDISSAELDHLFQSPRAALRQFACRVALHLQVKEAKEQVFQLLKDKNNEVRQSAILAFCLYYHELCSRQEKKQWIALVVDDLNPHVAITAAWAAFLVDPKWGESKIKRWLEDESPEIRNLAASALSASGKRGSEFLVHMAKKSTDPVVKLNLALGLIGQKIEEKKAFAILYDFLAKENHKLMWVERPFRQLCLSKVGHIPETPQYPEAVDAEVRLELITMLARGGDPRAETLLKSYLKNPNWGISAFAAVSLLQEGDQEALSLIRSLLKDKDSTIRIQAAIVLAFLGKDPSVFSVLEESYFQADHEKKLQILEAMGSIADEKSFGFFVKVLGEPFQILRILGASSLLQSLYQ